MAFVTPDPVLMPTCVPPVLQDVGAVPLPIRTWGAVVVPVPPVIGAPLIVNPGVESAPAAERFLAAVRDAPPRLVNAAAAVAAPEPPLATAIGVVGTTEFGVISPRVRLIAGVVVAVATVPDTPLAVVTETLVTVPVPADGSPVRTSSTPVPEGTVAAFLMVVVPPRAAHAESMTTAPPPEAFASFRASCSPNVAELTVSPAPCAFENEAVIR